MDADVIARLRDVIYWDPPTLGVIGPTERLLRQEFAPVGADEDDLVALVDTFWNDPTTLCGYLTALGSEFTVREDWSWPWQITGRCLLHPDRGVRLTTIQVLGRWRTDAAKLLLITYLRSGRETDQGVFDTLERAAWGI